MLLEFVFYDIQSVSACFYSRKNNLQRLDVPLRNALNINYVANVLVMLLLSSNTVETFQLNATTATTCHFLS